MSDGNLSPKKVNGSRSKVKLRLANKYQASDSKVGFDSVSDESLRPNFTVKNKFLVKTSDAQNGKQHKVAQKDISYKVNTVVLPKKLSESSDDLRIQYEDVIRKRSETSQHNAPKPDLVTNREEDDETQTSNFKAEKNDNVVKSPYTRRKLFWNRMKKLRKRNRKKTSGMKVRVSFSVNEDGEKSQLVDVDNEVPVSNNYNDNIPDPIGTIKSKKLPEENENVEVEFQKKSGRRPHTGIDSKWANKFKNLLDKAKDRESDNAPDSHYANHNSGNLVTSSGNIRYKFSTDDISNETENQRPKLGWQKLVANFRTPTNRYKISNHKEDNNIQTTGLNDNRNRNVRYVDKRKRINNLNLLTESNTLPNEFESNVNNDMAEWKLTLESSDDEDISF